MLEKVDTQWAVNQESIFRWLVRVGAVEAWCRLRAHVTLFCEFYFPREVAQALPLDSVDLKSRSSCGQSSTFSMRSVFQALPCFS
jgi:hypothetical protein